MRLILASPSSRPAERHSVTAQFLQSHISSVDLKVRVDRHHGQWSKPRQSNLQPSSSNFVCEMMIHYDSFCHEFQESESPQKGSQGRSTACLCYLVKARFFSTGKAVITCMSLRLCVVSVLASPHWSSWYYIEVFFCRCDSCSGKFLAL